MTQHHPHDTGYRELFSHPEFVQQLLEGFAPAEVAYQPHLRYYLIDEGAYEPEQLAAIGSPLSGVFGIETASDHRALQAAVERLAASLRNDPNRARLDRLITRWLKRHLQRLGAEVDLERIHSLVEDQSMLAENLEHWARREREAGHQEGHQEGRLEGEQLGAEKTRVETACNLLKLGVLSDVQIAQVTGLSGEQVRALREADQH